MSELNKDEIVLSVILDLNTHRLISILYIMQNVLLMMQSYTLIAQIKWYA